MKQVNDVAQHCIGMIFLWIQCSAIFFFHLCLHFHCRFDGLVQIRLFECQFVSILGALSFSVLLLQSSFLCAVAHELELLLGSLAVLHLAGIFPHLLCHCN